MSTETIMTSTGLSVFLVFLIYFVIKIIFCDSLCREYEGEYFNKDRKICINRYKTKNKIYKYILCIGDETFNIVQEDENPICGKYIYYDDKARKIIVKNTEYKKEIQISGTKHNDGMYILLKQYCFNKYEKKGD